MAHSSYRSNVTCPVCNHTQAAKLGSRVRGLVKCQHCQVCMVVTWSGHYVRDPFVHEQFISLRVSRRRRHFLWGRLKYPSVVLIVSSMLAGGLALNHFIPASFNFDNPQPQEAADLQRLP